MTVLRIALALLALVLCAAHLLRWAGPVAALLPLAAAGLLAVPRPWAAWALRAVLSLATLEWLRMAWLLVAERRALGLPAGRLLVILLAVAAVTAVAALLQRPRRDGGANASPAGRRT